MVVLLQEWLYLSTNLSSSQDDLNEISLKVSSFSRHAFRDARKKKLELGKQLLADAPVNSTCAQHPPGLTPGH